MLSPEFTLKNKHIKEYKILFVKIKTNKVRILRYQLKVTIKVCAHNSVKGNIFSYKKAQYPRDPSRENLWAIQREITS